MAFILMLPLHKSVILYSMISAEELLYNYMQCVQWMLGEASLSYGLYTLVAGSLASGKWSGSDTSVKVLILVNKPVLQCTPIQKSMQMHIELTFRRCLKRRHRFKNLSWIRVFTSTAIYIEIHMGFGGQTPTFKTRTKHNIFRCFTWRTRTMLFWKWG